MQEKDRVESVFLKEEYLQMRKERRLMLLEDKREEFRVYYSGVIEQLEREAAEKDLIKQKRELEEARYRKLREETKNIVES
jgi:hypothetical protein